MTSGRKDSFRLFRIAGIDVYVHWLWIFVAIYQIADRPDAYSSLGWNIAEYLTLFLIVLLHEFGHALACRQVGGTADQIMLWPLGGVAFVSPPRRPGATLWSIAAGPLVNVALFFVLTAVVWVDRSTGWIETLPDLHRFVRNLWYINIGLLIFNLLPIYPLDGGQILRSLLWFWLSEARSLFVASILGFVGVAGLALFAYDQRSIWMGVMTFFVFQQCQRGLARARALTILEKAPRRSGFSCPSCHREPLIGAFWQCDKCKAAFDTFETQANCPNCQEKFPVTICTDCRQLHPIGTWRNLPVVDVKGS